MTAIEFENVGKQYRLGLVSTRTLSHDLNRWWTINVLRKEDPYLRIGETNDRSSKGSSDYVWALKDINFKVEQGDVVGIIGRNGAGKSTLLKLLSKVTGPTTGCIRARGRIGSLLEVGTGFHPEMTGRENIYMNGAILGMTKPEITRKLDEIVDFSGCERYLDTPVKRYSSGMMVRLGFAVAAHLDPEILVVDEVLAVGDAEFQKKAIGKMKDVSQGEGRTVLFVSHNMNAVRNLCKNGIVLDKGLVTYSGRVSDCIDYYVSSGPSELCNYQADINASYDTKKVYFKSIRLENDSDSLNTVTPISLIIEVHANAAVKDCRINCTVFNSEDIPVGSISSTKFFDISSKETKTLRFEIKNHNLAKGCYSISFSVGSGNFSSGQTDFDIVQKVICFSIDKYDNSEQSYFALWNSSWGNVMFGHQLQIL